MRHPGQPHPSAPSAVPSPLSIALAGLSALAIAVGVGRFAFPPLLAMMVTDEALSVADGGWLASANYLAYLGGALAAIRIKVNSAMAIRFSLLLVALSTVAMGWGNSFPVWLVLRVIAGLASAWTFVFVSSWALTWVRNLGRPNLDGVLYTGVGTGIVLSGLLCLAFMDQGVHWPAAWLIFGALALAGTLALWRIVSLDPVASAPLQPARTRSPIDRRSAWIMVSAYGIAAMGYAIPATFLPVLARDAIANPNVFGWLWPAFGAAATVSTLAAAAPSRSLQARGLWISASFVMAIGVIVAALWPGLAGLAVAALCVGGTFMVITMAGMQVAKAIGGADARSLIAAMTASFAAGQILGPAVATAMLQAGGSIAEALLAAGLLLVISAFALRALPLSAMKG